FKLRVCQPTEVSCFVLRDLPILKVPELIMGRQHKSTCAVFFFSNLGDEVIHTLSTLPCFMTSINACASSNHISVEHVFPLNITDSLSFEIRAPSQASQG